MMTNKITPSAISGWNVWTLNLMNNLIKKLHKRPQSFEAKEYENVINNFGD